MITLTTDLTHPPKDTTMSFTLYRVDADNKDQRGIVLGPGFVCFSYDEAVAKAIEWKECNDLTNVKVSVHHYD